MKTNTHTERILNEQQLLTIELLYKFRFLNSQLLRQYKQLNNIQSINTHLKTLLTNDYIGQHYDTSYKIQGRGPEYYLKKKGINILRGRDDIPDRALNSMYHSSKIKPAGVQHYLDVARVFLCLRDSYPDEFFTYTKRELAQFDYFPDVPPDLYLNRDEHDDNKTNEYMLDIFLNEPIYMIKQRLSAYVEHYEDGEWQNKADTDYPAILLICKDEKVEKSIHRFVNTRLGFYADIYTTNITALLSGEVQVWRNCEEPDEPTEL